MIHFKMNLFATLLLCCFIHCSPFQNRSILVSKFGGKTFKPLVELQILRRNFREDFLKQLYSLPEVTRHELASLAQVALNQSWPVRTATEYMRYFSDGNRNIYEGKVHRQRSQLGHLLLGHLLDRRVKPNTTRFLNKIIDGVWSLMEDSTWAYPAHLYLQNSSDSLPLPSHSAIDLNTSEDGKFISWIKLLIGEDLNQISPVIGTRIDFELKRRIFVPYLDRADFFWMGFHKRHRVNNWNIWINGNILKAAMFTLDDERMFEEIANKTIYSVDYFLDGYGDDGGCNEGPAYWRQAGGRLVEFIQVLADLYDAKDYFENIQLIRNIGEYVYKMHIGQNWYVNFADSIPVIDYPPSVIAKYGLLYKDTNMQHFSAYVLEFYKDYFKEAASDINEFANFLHTRRWIESFEPEAPRFPFALMEDIQVLTSHSKELFVGAKFGNNDESHNHNDVGSFVLFAKGHPVLIDIGVGMYNSTTFGKHRYDIFYFQSGYHNCPTINGIDQRQGAEFKGQHVRFEASSNNQTLHFSGDISTAYPASAQVNSWYRSFHFNRTANSLELKEKFHLKQFLQPHRLNFIVMEKMNLRETKHGLFLHYGHVEVTVEFDSSMFEVSTDVRSLDNDQRLTKVWGKSIKRIMLRTKEHYKQLRGDFSIKFLTGRESRLAL